MFVLRYFIVTRFSVIANEYWILYLPSRWRLRPTLPGSRVTKRTGGWWPSHGGNGGVGKKVFLLSIKIWDSVYTWLFPKGDNGSLLVTLGFGLVVKFSNVVKQQKNYFQKNSAWNGKEMECYATPSRLWWAAIYCGTFSPHLV